MASSISATTAESELESTGVGEQSSCFSTTLDTTASSRLNATRVEFERRQLLHSIQLLKLELSQKNLIIDTLKGEHSNHLEELNERVSDVECEKKLLQHRLRAQAHIYEVGMLCTFHYMCSSSIICVYTRMKNGNGRENWKY